MNLLPVAPLVVLLAGVLLQLVLGRALGNKAKGWLALVCGLGALGCVLALLPSIAAGKLVDSLSFRWDSAAAMQLHVDGLGLLFALMATGIGSAILVYCVDYMAHEHSGTTRFYALMLTFIAGLVGLVFSANLLVAYLCWEVIGLCSYLLVGFWYKESAAADGARKVLLMTHLPGYALLLGILLLYARSGTFLWTDPALTAQFTTGIFLLMLVAAMAKSVMVPLHTWIPEAMNAPTPVSALLHSACYVKAGIYLIARMYSFSGNGLWLPGWSTLIMAIGCVTMLVGALFALAQTDLKRLLAYSTISQLGYIVAGIGLGPLTGLTAAMFYAFSHGLFKGTLFLCAGAIQHAAGTRDMRKLGGLAAKMPGTARIWLIATAAIIGVPLTNGFVAKWLLFDAAIKGGQWVVVVVAWLVSILTAFYMLKATISIFYGNLPEAMHDQTIEDAPIRMQLGMGLLAGLCVLFGILPGVLIRLVAAPAASVSRWPLTSLDIDNLNRLAAQVPSPVTAALVIAAIVIATLIWFAGRFVSRSVRTVNVFAGGDPLPDANNAGAEDYADLAQTVIQPAYRLMDPDPFYFGLGRAIQALAEWTGKGFSVLERRPIPALLVLAGVILAAAWLI